MTSLFTNIPLSGTIKLAADLIKASQPDLNISEKDLTSLFNFATCETHFLFLFNFATCETHFLFKGKFYDQIDGVAMGSPLAPVLANLFMGLYEKDWLNNYDGSHHRIIHDMLMMFFLFSIHMMRLLLFLSSHSPVPFLLPFSIY